MATTLWAVLVVLAAMLLAYTTYAAMIGLAGTFTQSRYEQCPRCHHHYLADPRHPQPHACPHGLDDRAYQAGWALVHHASAHHAHSSP